MKKIIIILLAIFAFGVKNVNAQDGIKIVTNHPDFKIKVKRCAASGKTVIVDLILNNEGTNDVKVRDVLVGCCSEAYDDEGNIYQNGNINGKVANFDRYLSTTGDFLILTGVPMKLSIQISNVSDSAESIARLSLYFDCPTWGLGNDKRVKITNIPILRQ